MLMLHAAKSTKSPSNDEERDLEIQLVAVDDVIIISLLHKEMM